MKKRMLYETIIIGVIVLFIGIGIQPAFAEVSIKTDIIIDDKEIDYSCGCNIDSNIRLTSKHLPLFRKSVRRIVDSQIKEFIQKIINVLEVNGNVDSKDIQEIVNFLNLNAKIKGIHFLCLLRSTGIGTAYARGVLPFIFDFVFYNLIIDESYIGPAILVEWDSPDADTYINRMKIYDDDSQKGYIFGFLGLTYAGGTWPCYYDVIGLCDFVIITEQDS